jgi:hypothetical protein
VQTFLPYRDFRRSALVLDRRRLGKQRVEALQVFRALTVPGYGWQHHPAVRMWAGYEEALVRYGLEVCRVWSDQGRPDTCADSLTSEYAVLRPEAPRARVQKALAGAAELPPWLGDAAFHRSHRSALLRKDPQEYTERFPGVPDDLPYVWPVSDRDPRAKRNGSTGA